MRQSMTGFATRSGTTPEGDWVWEARSVNGRGLDLRFRLPEGFDTLEPRLRAEAARRFKRGTIAVSLKVNLVEVAGLPRISPAGLAAALAQLAEIHAAAEARQLDIVASSAAEVLSLRGVTEYGRQTDVSALTEAAAAEVPGLLDALQASRAAEGSVLETLLGGHLDRMAELAATARGTAEARSAAAGDLLRHRVAEVVAAASVPLDEARIAQELALLAVKGDVTEEIDRLCAHIDAARALLALPEPAGRKLDFLTQEFLREVNTMCSKSGSQPLTALGLDLKAVIEQLREQVQNLE